MSPIVQTDFKAALEDCLEDDVLEATDKDLRAGLKRTTERVVTKEMMPKALRKRWRRWVYQRLRGVRFRRTRSRERWRLLK